MGKRGQAQPQQPANQPGGKREERPRPKVSGPIGRPSKLTPEVMAELVRLIKGGNYARTACAAVGIHEDTFHLWMKRGRDTKTGEYHQFFRAVTEARAEAETRNVMVVQLATRKNWKAAAWWLSRTNPERWGVMRNLRAAVDREMEATLDHLAKKLPADAFAAVIQALASDGEGGEEAAIE